MDKISTLEVQLLELPAVIAPTLNPTEHYRLTITKHYKAYSIFYYEIDSDSYLYSSTDVSLEVAALELLITLDQELLARNIKVIE